MSEINTNDILQLPLLPLRGLNVFPGVLLTFDVERPASVAALNAAVKHGGQIFLAAQKDISADAPGEDEIYHVGTVCRVRQQLRQPRANVCRVMVEGVYRAEALEMKTDGKYCTASVAALPDRPERVRAERKEALVRNCLSLFKDYLQLNPDMMNEQLLNVVANPDLGFIISYIAQNARFSVENKQKLLEELYPSRRLALLGRLLSREIEILNIEKELNDATQEQVNRGQREYFLREELKLIQSELGQDSESDDIDTYRAKIKALPVSNEIREKLLKELSKLQKQPFGSAKAAVIRGYLDVCLEIPWGVRTKETVDTQKARKVLDADHYGLEKVKERILEYLAVRQLSPGVKGGLLCLVGPPGTGKTSIALSIARAVNRKCVRISLGGIHDEAEIRGHRKTYIGSMPGRIMNGIIQAGSCNPLMVLDEIDKLGSDYRGDPSAALLEALDGEQNSSFRDHFLEIPFDLSEVFFITTANTTGDPLRPVRGLFHHHREHDRHDPARAARPHGSHRDVELHRRGEAADRQAPSDPQTAKEARPQGRAAALRRRRRPRDHFSVHPRVRRPRARARDREDLPQDGLRARRGAPPEPHGQKRRAGRTARHEKVRPRRTARAR